MLGGGAGVASPPHPFLPYLSLYHPLPPHYLYLYPLPSLTPFLVIFFSLSPSPCLSSTCSPPSLPLSPPSLARPSLPPPSSVPWCPPPLLRQVRVSGQDWARGMGGEAEAEAGAEEGWWGGGRWVLFNDFVITPQEERDVLHFQR